jgi:hypothetical protein
MPFIEEPITLVMARSRLKPDSKPGQKRIQHWNFAQRPFYGNPKHRQMPGLLLASTTSFVPHPVHAKAASFNVVTLILIISE